MKSLQNWLVALGRLYWTALVQASKALAANWLIVPASLVLYLLVMVGYTLFAPLKFAGGLLVGLLQLVLLSFFYSYISRALNGDKLRVKELWEFDYELLNSIASVAFIFFIAILVASFGTHGSGNQTIPLILQLGLVFIFNTIPEVIYIKRLQGMEALSYSWNFTRDNWIEWYLPLLVCILPWLVASPYSLLVAFSTSEPLLPTLLIMNSVSRGFTGLDIIGTILALVIAIWFMLLRGFIFNSLESGAWKRQRY